MDEALVEAFGRDRALLDWSEMRDFGAKVAVTATTIGDSSLCIFRNYNGRGDRPPNCGYRIIKPTENMMKLRVWEA
jgi:hypothetical protein